jgi:hypothetical protein
MSNFQNNILQEQELFMFTYSMVLTIFQIIKLDTNLEAIIKNSFENLELRNKLLIINNLMEKKVINDWATKDAKIMSIFIGMLLYIYKKKEKKIEKALFKSVELFMEEGQSGIMSENNMKRNMDNTMTLKKLFSCLDNFNINLNPYGSWVLHNNEVLIKLEYPF